MPTIVSSPRRRSAASASITAKPTTAQSRVLVAAAQRTDQAVLPLPDGMPQRGAVWQRLLRSLLDRGLVREVACKDASKAWRADARGRSLTLRLTPAGVAAVGSDPVQMMRSEPIAIAKEAAGTSGGASDAAKAAPTARASKLGQILAALTTAQGATLAELVALTGWLPHTTRAALCRLRQRGHAIQLTHVDGRKAYHLTGAEAADSSPAPADSPAARP